MGGAGHSKTQQTADWPQWVLPQAQNYLQQYQQTVLPGGQLGPYPAGLNQQLAPFTPVQQEAMQGILGQTGPMQNLVDTGGGQLHSILGGQYLNPATNPWLNATYDMAARGLTQQYETATAPSLISEAMRAGAYGGTGFNQQQAQNEEGLGRSLSDLGTQIYGGNYSQAMQNIMQGLGLLPSVAQAEVLPQQQALGVGTLQQQQGQSGLDVAFQNALRQQQFPLQQLDQYGGALGTAAGPAYASNTIVPIKSGYMGYK